MVALAGFKEMDMNELMNTEGGASWAAWAACATGIALAAGGACLAVAALPVAPIIVAAAVGGAVFSGNIAVVGVVATATFGFMGY
jgi:lactobin A/cerein 7B family class IIb bacteriocin